MRITQTIAATLVGGALAGGALGTGAGLAGALTGGSGGGLAVGPGTGLTGDTHVSGTGTTADPVAESAGAFLARELDAHNGTLPDPGTDQADLGVTIDAVLGMLATRTGPREATAAAAAISADADTYLGPGLAPTELYAGPVAKAMLLAHATGLDPRAFAGHDLVADLEGLQTADGHYADRTAYGDSSNSFTQGLALLADRAVTGDLDAKGVNFLVAQQCSDGGVRLYVAADGCLSDPDATAMAALALREAPGGAAVVRRALGYLSGRLTADGGLAGGVGAETPNSNSTGLAAAAFALAGASWSDEAAATRGFLLGLQFDCTAPQGLRGAVAYDRAGYEAGMAAGPGATAGDQERRATAQAALGLARADLSLVNIGDALDPSPSCGPTGTATQPTGTATQPTGTATQPTGTVTQPTGTATQPTGTVTQPTVTVTQPTVTVTQPMGTSTDTHPNASTTAPPARPTSPRVGPTRHTAAPAVSTPESSSGGTETTGSMTAGELGTTGGPGSTTLAVGTAGGPVAIATTAVAAPAPAGSGDDSPLALAAAGALILLGGAGAAYILRRGRTH